MSQISNNKNIASDITPENSPLDSCRFQEIFKQLSEECYDYYDEKEFIFGELRKYPGHENYIFIFKKYLDDGFHIESYRTTDIEPYYVQHGIYLLYSRGDMSEFEDALPDFDVWSSTPYFILNHDLYKDGISIGPSFVMGDCCSSSFALGNSCGRIDYFKFLPELNINFRERYGYLNDFLDSPEDDVYVMRKSEQ